MSEKVIKRYGDAELATFKAVIDKKLAQAREELAQLSSQIEDMNDIGGDDNYDAEDGSANTERDYLTRMANRQIEFIRQMESALLRIKNKTYGICVVTGNLIEKQRLMAVPHTTKSVSAKNHTPAPQYQHVAVNTQPTGFDDAPNDAE